MDNEQKTDLVVANERLLAVKPNVTATDRKEAPASEAIVVQYLNGKGKDLEMAMSLLQFFLKKIESRRKVLDNAKLITASA